MEEWNTEFETTGIRLLGSYGRSLIDGECLEPMRVTRSALLSSGMTTTKTLLGSLRHG